MGNVMNAKCSLCKAAMPQERLDNGLPFCIKCSDQSGVVGFQVFEHKTGGTPVILSKSDKNAIYLAQRANRRAR